MTNNYKFLNFKLEDKIGFLELSREDKLNALNLEVINELISLFESLASEKLAGLIFTGQGKKSFIAGADISQMINLTSDEACEFSQRGQHLTLLMERSSFPIIAAVNGFCLGGGLEMALACDFIYCSENALFGLPEVSLGLIPGFGGTQRLAKVIGRSQAKELIYTAAKIKSEQAQSLGLAQKVFPDKESLIEGALNTIKKIGLNSSFAVATAKSVLNEGVDLTNEDGLRGESLSFGKLFSSYDMKEGTSAFMEKRKANFKGE